MSKWKAGDRVRLVTREQSAKDVRENTYFPHMAGLEGTVTKVYSPEEVCVVIDRETLPENNAGRHAEIETHLQERWLDSISQEARSKLSDEEKQFHLNYSLLVSETDLEPIKGKKASKSEKDERPRPADLDRSEEEFLKQRKQS
jgi:hypothetical protein